MTKSHSQPADDPPDPLPSDRTLRLPLGLSVPLAFSWTAVIAFSFAQKARIELAFFPDLFSRLVQYQNLTAHEALKLVLLLGFWFVWTQLGDVILRALKLVCRDRLENALVSAGLGATASMLLLLGLGLLGFWQPSFLRVLFYSAVTLSVGALGLRLRGPSSVSDQAVAKWKEGRLKDSSLLSRRSFDIWEIAAVGLIVAAVVVNLVAAAVPEIFYDALVYHLALPKLYLLRHQITPTPYNVYSGVPFGIEMLYGLALAFPVDGLPGFINASLGIATVLVLLMWGRRYARPSTGILAALLFYLCPSALSASEVPGIDLGSCFFCALAFVALLRSIESAKEKGAGWGVDETSFRWSILSGLFVGAAMSTKYSVFPVGIVLLLVHFLLGRQHAIPTKNTLAFGAAAALPLLPWLLKNAAFFHNPFYPFGGGLFDGHRPADLQGFLSAGGARDLRGALTTLAGFRTLLTEPWTVSINSRYLSDWPGPAYLMLTPWAFLVRWKDWRSRAAILAAAGCYLSWLSTTGMVRFLLPAFPFIACSTALAINESPFPKWLRRAGWTAALVSCAFSLQAIFNQSQAMGAWNYAEPYKARYLGTEWTSYPAPYYSAMEFIEKNLPADARVLFLGEARGYHCERDFIASTVYDLNPFWTQLREARTAEDLRQGLRNMGVTHIFLNAIEMFHRQDSSVVMPRADIESKVFGDFWALYLRQIFEDRQLTRSNAHWTLVYELRDKTNTKRSEVPFNVPRNLLRLAAPAPARSTPSPGLR